MRFSRGTSLLELLLALALGAVVLTAGGKLLLALRRFWFAEREALAARHAVRAATVILTAELRAVSPSSGDLLRTSDTALTIRAPRGLFEVCRPATPGSVSLVVRRDAALAPSVPVAGRDSLLVFRAGASASQDRWLHASLAALSGASCSDSTPAWRLRLALARDSASLDSVALGAPARVFETLRYRLYSDGAGAWWLGVRAWQGSSWAATSPLAGPFVPRSGVTFEYRDAAGAPAASDTTVRLMVVAARAAARSDSMVSLVAPRNE